MNFWTAMRLDCAAYPYHRLYSSILNNVISDSAGGAYTDPLTAAIVIANPAPQDIAALGNALILWDSNSPLAIAISPESVDTRGAPMNDIRCATKYYTGASVTAELIINGETAFICQDCDKLFTRSVGGCTPGVDCTKHALFPCGSKITLPPEDLHMPVKKCCYREAFKRYTLRSVELSCTPEDPLGTEEWVTRAAVNSGTSKMMRSIGCSRCMFKDCLRTSSVARCTVGSKPGYCSGPYFEFDVAEPSLDIRRKLRLMGTDIPWAKFLEVRRKYPGWCSTNWRKDPGIELGVVGGTDLGLVKTSCTSPNYDVDVAPKAALETICKEFDIREPVIPGPTSMLEKLLCLGFSGRSIRHTTRAGWGGSVYNSLKSVWYADNSDSGGISFFLTSNIASTRVFSVLDLVRSYPSIVSSIHTGRRGQSIRRILALRGDAGRTTSKQKRICTKILDTVEAIGKAGGPAQSVGKLYEEYVS